jgi:hypothetical protein
MSEAATNGAPRGYLGTMRRALTAATAWLLLAAAAFAAPALGSSRNESIFMDDPKVVYSSPENLEPTLAEMKALGADRIRVSVFWRLLAPAPDSQERPFAAGSGANPSNYSAEKWDRYDRIVLTAQKLGLRLIFNITSPAPDWATGTPSRPDIKDTWRPNAADFRDFVTAVGTRYSGSFLDEAVRHNGVSFLGPCDPTPNVPMPPPVCASGAGADPSAANPNPPNTGPVLPRVDTWSVWNEPNMPGWLTPQWDTHPNDPNRLMATSPHVYRELLDGAWAGLADSGHGTDTILIVEAAPRGAFKRTHTQSIAPLRFLRELYCVDDDYRPFTGGEASARGCPDGGSGFTAAHPALFDATAFAHHPYALQSPPGATDKTSKDHVVMRDLDRLTVALDRLMRVHGRKRRYPIWLTEYGYQTEPPDPYAGWPWETQARFLAEAEWLAYRHPRVRSMTQFLLYDDAPLHAFPADDPRHWGTFQTGLRTLDGTRKDSYSGYQRPIHVTPGVVKRGRQVVVFAMYRPGTGAVRATLQVRPRGRKGWRSLHSRDTNSRGFLKLRVKVRRGGAFRVAFRVGDSTVYTRAASFRVTR